MKTIYEWSVNEMDGEDIVENHFCESLVKSGFVSSEINENLTLELVKSKYKSDGEIVDRQYCCVESMGLPSEFDGGDSVPCRFVRELHVWSAK
jgi:hypothetical protein